MHMIFIMLVNAMFSIIGMVIHIDAILSLKPLCLHVVWINVLRCVVFWDVVLSVILCDDIYYSLGQMRRTCFDGAQPKFMFAL
jgi:hypothetical protein